MFNNVKKIYLPFTVSKTYLDLLTEVFVILPGYIISNISDTEDYSNRLKDKLKLYSNSEYSGATFTTILGEIEINVDFSNVDKNISDTKIVVDFGDGTILNKPPYKHFYSDPGNYNINVYSYDINDTLVGSSNSYFIRAIDYISDNIFMKESSILGQSIENIKKINLTRLSNPTNTRNLSSNNFTISLSVSGSDNNFYNSKKYYNEKDLQFKSSSYFFDKLEEKYNVIDEITTNNILIYGKLTPIFGQLGGIDKYGLLISSSSTFSSFLLGSSGHSQFYYYNDF